MPSRDSELRQVAADLESQMEELRGVVAELNAILLPPESDETKEQVAAQ